MFRNNIKIVSYACSNMNKIFSRHLCSFNFSISLFKLPNKSQTSLLKSHSFIIKRYYYKKSNDKRKSTTSVLLYVTSIGIFMLGMAYAGVPLYRLFCQATGYGGEIRKNHDKEKIQDMVPIKERQLRIRFNADTASTMMWNFRPQQKEIKLYPGETALAFYKAKNPSDVPIVGVSTYNVVPFEAGPYFNKIQCFCFEEQRLNPHEEVDMPVFFYIDPEFCDDPLLDGVTHITLSYTFFEAKDAVNLMPPSFATPHIKQAQ